MCGSWFLFPPSITRPAPIAPAIRSISGSRAVGGHLPAEVCGAVDDRIVTCRRSWTRGLASAVGGRDAREAAAPPARSGGSEPLPAHRTLAGAAEDAVDLAAGGVRQRPALA